MSQQAPKLVSDTHYCVVGDVTIDESAAIASGVVLQAASGSRIVICKGVCLAAGVCIQSRKGVLTISAGASLGANVLIVGNGEVGADACVSSGSTLVNPSVSAEGIVPPDALIENRLKESRLIENGESQQKQAHSSKSNSFQSDSFQSDSFQSNGYQTSSFQSNSFQSNGSQTNGYQTSSFQSNGYQTDGQQNSFQANSYQSNGQQSSYQSNEFQETHHSYSSFQTQHTAPSADVQSTYRDQNGTSAHQNGVSKTDASQMVVHASYDRVYGREQVTRLISALFPNRHNNQTNS